MDNLKYYNDSFAYDYNIFAPAETGKKADIINIPDNNRSAHARSALFTKAFSKMFKAAVTVFVMMAICGGLYLRAEIASLQSNINKIDKEITEYKGECTRLEVEIERRSSVANLEESAKELGMQKCEKNQVVYIRTDKSYDIAAANIPSAEIGE